MSRRMSWIFASTGGYETGAGYVDGLVAATWIVVVVVGVGALAALAIPAARRRGSDASILTVAAAS